MEITGKVQSLLPLQKGTGKNGEWKKQEFILETQSQFPKKVCVALWGPKVDQYKLKPGDMITAKIEVESREFNGKWYTDVKAYQISSNSSKGEEGNSFNQDISDTYFEESSSQSSDSDDLPF